MPAKIRRPFENTDEQRGWARVETLGHTRADAHAHFAAARAGLLCLTDVEHLSLAWQVGTTFPPTVTPALHDHFWDWRFSRRRWQRLPGGTCEVEEHRPLDALGAPTERHSHQILNVSLLLVDGCPQLRDRLQQFGDHLLEDDRIVGQVGRIVR